MEIWDLDLTFASNGQLSLEAATKLIVIISQLLSKLFFRMVPQKKYEKLRKKGEGFSPDESLSNEQSEPLPI
jgi:hypothetical protein